MGISNDWTHSAFIISMICWQDQRKCTLSLWTLFCNFPDLMCGKFGATVRWPDCLLVTQSSKNRRALLMIWSCQNWCNPEPKIYASQLIKVFMCAPNKTPCITEAASLQGTVQFQKKQLYRWVTWCSLLATVTFCQTSYFGHSYMMSHPSKKQCIEIIKCCSGAYLESPVWPCCDFLHCIAEWFWMAPVHL